MSVQLKQIMPYFLTESGNLGTTGLNALGTGTIERKSQPTTWARLDLMPWEPERLSRKCRPTTWTRLD